MWSPPLLLVAPADSLAFRSTQKGPVSENRAHQWYWSLGRAGWAPVGFPACVLWSGCPSTEMAVYLFRNALHPKNLSSRWETKACPFQLESQTGTWGRPAYGLRGPSWKASESLSRPDPSLSVGQLRWEEGRVLPRAIPPSNCPCVRGLKIPIPHHLLLYSFPGSPLSRWTWSFPRSSHF